MNEVRLYRKLNSDYDLRIAMLNKEKDEAEERNLASRNRLVEVEYVNNGLCSKLRRLMQES